MRKAEACAGLRHHTPINPSSSAQSPSSRSPWIFLPFNLPVDKPKHPIQRLVLQGGAQMYLIAASPDELCPHQRSFSAAKACLRADRLSWCGLRDAQPTQPSRCTGLSEARLLLGSLRRALRRADCGVPTPRLDRDGGVREELAAGICRSLINAQIADGYALTLRVRHHWNLVTGTSAYGCPTKSHSLLSSIRRIIQN